MQNGKLFDKQRKFLAFTNQKDLIRRENQKIGL